MFIELVDQLRCIRPHESSWLVASAARMEGRDIVSGLLGCPVCRTEYPIERGIARFDRPLAGEGAPPAPDAAVPDAAAAPANEAGDEMAMRLTALLGLAGGGGFAIIGGHWGRHAATVHELSSVPLLLLEPPDDVAMGDGLSGVRAAGAVPVARGSTRAVALGPGTTSPAQVEGAVRVLRPRGRLVAPAEVPVPPGIREIARDATMWVGERVAESSPPVRLSRATSA